MTITDEHTLKTGLGSNFTSNTWGIVFKTSKEMKEEALGLIIPKFQVGYTFKNGDTPKETPVTIRNTKIINDSTCKFGSSKAKMKNYIKVYPLLNQNQNMALYIPGDKVEVTFMDEDIKTPAFLPYSINRLGQRKEDNLIFGVPSTPDTNNALTTENMYYIQFDSVNQVLTLSTSMANKEVCTFTLSMDGKAGILKLTDTERTFTIDNKADTISMKNAAGSSITMQEDQITISSNTINIIAESDLIVTSESETHETSTYESTADKYIATHENEEVTVTKGLYKIRDEKHENTSFSIKGSTAHFDCATNGFNGQVILPTFTIGACSNINVPAIPINGTSGPNGSMILDTGIGLPLVKHMELGILLTALAGVIDTKIIPPSPVATTLVSSMLALSATTKIMSL